MADHTPGPWAVHYDDDGVEIRAAGDMMGIIIHGKEMDANARLISQTPALLRIVKTLCEYADVGRLVCEGAAVDYAVLDEAIGAARDAIAKIEEV